ncbi:DUF3124 domain-containing protein [Persicobacter diffluens]|uniref:DUF3124 domain-containing protein n=1 Tax=Persicobacter diffluens TaxID=981 RepID=A0AAN4W2N2_9BACT|nr:hypothetical protein PEDI_34070 [Persicobacter diffluens]
MNRISLILSFFISLSLYSCGNNNSPLRNKAKIPTPKYQFSEIKFDSLSVKKKAYIPVYSDIYLISEQRKVLLTATVSIRNTCFNQTMYLNRMDYYDSKGKLLEKHVTKTIEIPPLNSVEFIIEHKEDKGGAGANYIVDYGFVQEDNAPLIEAVMIGISGNHSISFTSRMVPLHWED